MKVLKMMMMKMNHLDREVGLWGDGYITHTSRKGGFLPLEEVEQGEEEDERKDHASIDQQLVHVLAILDHPHHGSREAKRVAHVQQPLLC